MTLASLHVYYVIDSSSEVYLLFSCYGSGHMLDPSIVTRVGMRGLSLTRISASARVVSVRLWVRSPH